jgi:hypothetical protein
MSNGESSFRGGAIALGALLALGLIAGGAVLGGQIKATRMSDRFVSVKGLVERRVKSDLAIWALTFKEAGDDLAAVYARSEAHQKVVAQFLADQGIQPSEIEFGVVRVIDTQANEYGGTRAPQRYIVEQRVTVRTSRVDQVAAAVQKTMLLVQKGVILTSNPGQGGLTYKFTGLNGIKPDMITEATRNARTAADRFASDSGSKVGSIRQANQGVFSILPADQASDAGDAGEGGGMYMADTSVMKTVRVVTSVQYYLEK